MSELEITVLVQPDWHLDVDEDGHVRIQMENGGLQVLGSPTGEQMRDWAVERVNERLAERDEAVKNWTEEQAHGEWQARRAEAAEARDEDAEDRVRRAIIDFVPGLRKGGEPGWDVLDDFNKLMGR